MCIAENYMQCLLVVTAVNFSKSNSKSEIQDHDEAVQQADLVILITRKYAFAYKFLSANSNTALE